MNISKLILTLCSICFAASSATAQQMGTSDAGRAENAALALQLKNQKEAMEQLQQNLEEITNKINNSSTGLDAVREKITNPTTGLEKRIQDSEGRKPVLAIAHTYCHTGQASSCDLECNNYSRHSGSYNTPNKKRPIASKYLKENYDDLGYVRILGTNVQRNIKVDPNPNDSFEMHRVIQLGGIDLDAGYTSANCKATQIERCAETVNVCIKRGSRCARRSGRTCTEYECLKYAPTACKVWKKEFVNTICEAQCGAVGFRKK